MHLVERAAQPDKFGTNPDAMWWAIVTLGTVGYGRCCAGDRSGSPDCGADHLCRPSMVALPVGIVATAFADEVHRGILS